MSDEAIIEEKEPKGAKDTEPAAEPNTSDNGTQEHMIPKSRLDDEINKRKELEKRLSVIEAANTEAEEKRLKDNEQYKELADKYQLENEKLKPLADVAEAQEKTLQDYLAAQIEELPEDARSMVPEDYSTLQKLRWLSDNKVKLMKPVGPDIGAGERGGSQEKTVALTQEQKAIAKKTGVSEADYAKNLTIQG